MPLFYEFMWIGRNARIECKCKDCKKTIEVGETYYDGSIFIKGKGPRNISLCSDCFAKRD